MVIFPQRKEWVTRVHWINVPVYFETPKPLSRALNPPVCNSVKPWCDCDGLKEDIKHTDDVSGSVQAGVVVLFMFPESWNLVHLGSQAKLIGPCQQRRMYAESTRRAFLYFEAQSFLGAAYPWENTLWGFSCISFLLICPIIETFLRARWVVGILWSFPLLRSQSPPRI